MDRRDTLQWMLAAAAATAWGSLGAAPVAAARESGYGTDPNLLKPWHAGQLWPLTFTAAQRTCAAALCGLVIPADAHSPSAAQLQVHLFIDEWISAPYPDHVKDRARIVDGLAWLDAESARRHAGKPFAEADAAQQQAICDDICWAAKAAPAFAEPAKFFALFRDLTAGGFYTTPAGTKDLQYAGNVASATFDGPPQSVLTLVGVS